MRASRLRYTSVFVPHCGTSPRQVAAPRDGQKTAAAGLSLQNEPPLAEGFFGVRVRRGEDTGHANPVVNGPGKTFEFRAVHFLARIFPQSALQPRFLAGTGWDRKHHFVLRFLDLVPVGATGRVAIGRSGGNSGLFPRKRPSASRGWLSGGLLDQLAVLPKDERQAELAVLGLNVPGGATQGAFSADYKRRCGRAFSVFGVASVFTHTVINCRTNSIS